MTVKDTDMGGLDRCMSCKICLFPIASFLKFFLAVMNQLALVQILLVVSLPTWITAMNFCSYDIRIHECDVTSETSLLLQVATVFL